MTNQTIASDLHLQPTASSLRVGARVAVLVALCAALVGGFLADVSGRATPPAGELAGAPAVCTTGHC